LWLLSKIGVSNVAQVGAENSDYSDTNINSKWAYLSNVVINGCENVLYSLSVKDNSNNVIESIMVWDHSENIYHSKAVTKSFSVLYSKDITNSNNIRFSSNLQGCTECISCNDLQNQSYCIDNICYPKEDYTIRKRERLQDPLTFQSNQEKSLNIACLNVTWSSNIECNDCENTFLSYNVKNWRNLILHGSAQWSEYAYDCFTWWSPYASHMYGVMWAGACEHVYCSVFVNGWSNNIYYSINIDACSFCLGCIGLKNKSYCILNKQYTKEERYEKVDEIFTQMERDWQLWEFFPATMNPFYFNDTAAYLIDPSFTKEEVTAKWYFRRDEPIKVDIPEGMEIVYTSSPSLLLSEKGDHKTLDDFEWFDDQGNWTINADILKCVIQDEQWNVYRIIPMEYKFLVKHGLPIPRKHWLERMKENFRIN